MHATLYVGLMVAAALAFTIGGVFMKWSGGLSQTLPTLAMLGLFVVGAILLTMSIDVGGELGPAYLVVLGLETVLAFALGVLVFGEHATVPRLLGLGLLVVGMILIEVTSSPPEPAPAALGPETVSPQAAGAPR
jgi:multidrug transporter EmrE-like cation transporter